MPYIDESYFSNVELEPDCATYTEEQSAAFEKVKRLCLSRERGSAELIARLKRDGFEADDAAVAVERAVSCGLVDDVRFGETLVRTRISQGKGRHGIEEELNRNGIAPSDIPGWPSDFFNKQSSACVYSFGDANEVELMQEGFGCDAGDALEVQRALDLLRRKPPRSKNVKASAYRKLISKGYSSSVAMAAVNKFMDSQD